MRPRNLYLWLIALVLFGPLTANAQVNTPTKTVREEFEAEKQEQANNLFKWYWNLDFGGTKVYTHSAMSLALGAGIAIGPIIAGVRPLDLLLMLDEDRTAINATSFESRLNLKPYLPIIVGGGYLKKGRQWAGADYPEYELSNTKAYWLAGFDLPNAAANEGYHATLHIRGNKDRTEIVFSIYQIR